jgi:ADP-ribose pyrophosphatase
MWKQLSTKQIFTHPRMTLVEDEVQVPNGAVISYLTVVHRSDSTTIICLDGHKVLVQQEYSYPMREVLYQFPGGKIEGNDSPELTARRELQEESGYSAKTFTRLGWYYPDNRRSSAKMHVFLAEDVVACEKRGGDIEEDITSTWISIKKLNQMISDGAIVNFSILAGWSLFQHRKVWP